MIDGVKKGLDLIAARPENAAARRDARWEKKNRGENRRTVEAKAYLDDLLKRELQSTDQHRVRKGSKPSSAFPTPGSG